MDRLTVPYGYAPGYYRRTGVSMKEVFNRLAAYEDTGLTPGDVKDLQALCKENGLAKYVDLIVEAKRSMGISNERSIEQDERIEQLEAGNARLRAERDKAVRRLRYEWEDILPVEYTGTTHHLKTVQPYYAASEIGEKTFELRKDDRNYAIGDILHLCEWDGNQETWRSHYKQVTYILRDAPYVPNGYACLAVLPVTAAAVRDAKIEWRGTEGKA
jgi:hypothetical protein